MDFYLLLKTVHVVGGMALFGIALGAAYFVFMARRTGDAAIVAHTARLVVMSDAVMTATAVVLQPLTGISLAQMTGQSILEGWLLASLLLYVAIGALWLPLMVTQAHMREVAEGAVEAGEPLPAKYHSLYRRWFALGVPVGLALVVLTWLMIAKPTF